MDFLKDIGERHERLKKQIHNFRMPLSKPFYRLAMMFYIITPVIVGSYVMEYTNKQQDVNLGKEGSKLGGISGNNMAERGVALQNEQLQRVLNKAREKQERSA